MSHERFRPRRSFQADLTQVGDDTLGCGCHHFDVPFRLGTPRSPAGCSGALGVTAPMWHSAGPNSDCPSVPRGQAETVRPCGRICPPRVAHPLISTRPGRQVLPRHALEDGRHLLDSPMPPDHDEDAWEIKFPITLHDGSSLDTGEIQ